jgi:hypothetical protein
MYKKGTFLFEYFTGAVVSSKCRSREELVELILEHYDDLVCRRKSDSIAWDSFINPLGRAMGGERHMTHRVPYGSCVKRRGIWYESIMLADFDCVITGRDYAVDSCIRRHYVGGP